MKRFASYFLYTLLLAAVVCACCSSCSDKLDIKQIYSYDITMLPVTKSLEMGRTVKLEFSVLKDGNYIGSAFRFRYFQPEGEGLLFDMEGKLYEMNRYYTITSPDNFYMLYQSACTSQQQLDFVFEDNFKQVVEKTVAFTNKKQE